MNPVKCRNNPAVWIAASIFLFLGNTPAEFKGFEFSGFAQGTRYHITYFAQAPFVTQSQFEDTFIRLDSALSIYKPWSLINRFNLSAGGIQADRHLRAVAEKSLEVFRDSKGLFDITVYPVMRAWGFGNKAVSTPPDSAAIKALMHCVGSEKLYLKGNFLGKSDPCVEIDVNGIAQGYSVDVIARLLEGRGIQNYLVEVGGEIRVKGQKYPQLESFHIGIEAGLGYETEGSDIKRVIKLDHGAVTTSGIGGKQRKSGNTVITHLMNPKTGFPLSNEMISATVIADDAMTADGYDNVLMGLGMREALAFMQLHKEMEAYLIFRAHDGSIGDTATAGFYKMIDKY